MIYPLPLTNVALAFLRAFSLMTAPRQAFWPALACAFSAV
jgi:hypothetical protein